MTPVESKIISGNDLSDDQQPVHTMYLMYHVTANITDTQIHIPAQAETGITYAVYDDGLYFDNFPDSAFKPPKYTL